ncbi:MAG: formylmethanofuran dehydrogenase subunit E family protein [Pseudomonadota bacterium]
MKNNKKMIGRYSFKEYVAAAKDFHGYPAPGILVGGIMVDYAMQHMPEGVLFEALCETLSCLPDAIQILTPCTTGNGRVTVNNLGLFALSLYDKFTGEGVRVFLDPKKLEQYPEIKSWLFKLKTKKEQNKDLLLEQIEEAGADICGIQSITIDSKYLGKHSKGAIIVCTNCKEAYPQKDGSECLSCQGKSRYIHQKILNHGL